MKNEKKERCSWFDFEQKILGCWHVTDELKTIIWYLESKNTNKEDAIRLLKALDTFYDVKFNELFDCFENVDR